MTITSIGYTGTVNEAEWARLALLMGTDYSVEDAAALLVTPVSGTRSVSIAPGDSMGTGVIGYNSEAVVKALGTPTAGQWHLIVMRRDWTTHASTIEVIPGAVTTNVTPTAKPTSYPAARNRNPGVLDDQPLGWAWTSNLSNVVTVWDIRQRRIDQRTTVLYFSDLEEVPATYAPSAHTLDSHTGTLGVAKGGTGATTPAAALTALGAQPAGNYQPAGSYASASHNHNATYAPIADRPPIIVSASKPAGQIAGRLWAAI